MHFPPNDVRMGGGSDEERGKSKEERGRERRGKRAREERRERRREKKWYDWKVVQPTLQL